MLRLRITLKHEGKEAKVYRDTEWSEYRVRFKGQPDADYHTDNLNDAINTAKNQIGLDIYELSQEVLKLSPTEFKAFQRYLSKEN